MNALITGSNGFTGRHLAEFIKREGLCGSIYGVDLSPGNQNKNVDEYFRSVEIDALGAALRSRKDQIRVFHLAGIMGGASLPKFIRSNVLWTAEIVSCLLGLGTVECFLNVGSSAEYGPQTKDVLTEDLTPNPVNFYGLSKHLQTQLMLSTSRMRQLPVICTRTFNLVGPGLAESLVCGTLARQFADIKQNKVTSVSIGRTDATREFIDVRDAVKVYWGLAANGTRGEVYNVANGNPASISEVIGIMQRYVRREVPLVKKPPANDIDFQRADVSKLARLDLGFKRIGLSQSLIDMIEHHME